MAERRRAPLLLWAIAGLAAAALFAARVASAWPAAGLVAGDLPTIILLDTVLPRAAVAVLAGAALGLAGLMMQQSLRNPLAEPSTLGVSSGAQLALAAATIHAPDLLAGSREAVALAGGLGAVAIVLALTARRGFEPVAVVLAGMIVALTAAGLAAALVLANGEYMLSLFIWGGGSLVQNDWGPSAALALRLAGAMAIAGLLLRPLAILEIDDAVARNLGVALPAVRLGGLVVAVWLAASVVAEVGVIGFVGLAGPALAHLSGARGRVQRLVAAPLIGAILLWLTDGLLQTLAGPGQERIPAGAATALAGAPLLVWLLPRLKLFEWPVPSPVGTARIARPGRALALAAAGCATLAAVSLTIGRAPSGWSLATGPLLADLAVWRLPRIGAATAAGAMLGAAGAIVQRISGNPLGGPEILDVGTGAGVGLAAAVALTGAAGPAAMLGGSTVGAVAALAAVLAFAGRGGFGPSRLLLAGLAVSALCSAILTAVIATGGPLAFLLIGWMAGSTNAVEPGQAALALACVGLLVALALAARRWLDLVPLGEAAPRALGLPVGPVRFVLVLLAGLMTAAASILVGPLSFVGLIAPHLARRGGFSRAAAHLAASALIGAGLMILADWLARTVAFPYQLPTGLFAGLIGGPYLIWSIARGDGRHA